MTALIACGGGGGSTAMRGAPTTMMPPPVATPTIMPPTSSNPQTLPEYGVAPAAARSNLGGTTPTVTTYSDIIGAFRARAADADTLQLGEIRLTGGVGLVTGAIQPDCAATTSCTVAIPDIGDVIFSITEIHDPSIISDTGLNGYNTEVQSIAVDGGVTLVSGRGAARGDGATPFTFQTYAGWLDGSVFGVEFLSVTENTTATNRLIHFSFGNDSDTNPTAIGSETSARWTGVAVGLDRTESFFHQGDVTVDINDFSNPDVDVAISNFKTSLVSARGPGETRSWTDLTLDNGTFEQSSASGLYIRGSFYGDGHEEVGGVFSYTNFYGAFGATRQTQ